MSTAQELPWKISPDQPEWQSPAVTSYILGEKESAGEIPVTWVKTCANRLKNLRTTLQGYYVGLDHVIDWLLAALIARENALLLGPPGVAKSELATRVFQLLGLTKAEVQKEMFGSTQNEASLHDWWTARNEMESKKQKYFHYLLSRFTQPEELFGPIEINLLRKGILVRINFGLLTGPGVRAAFLDEIFKASSSILNTLLTLTQERQYFNLGGMVRSDLVMLIGASNELPGGFFKGTYGLGSGGDDFQALYAFLDRFPIRLSVPVASGSSTVSAPASDLALATQKAIGRERARFSSSSSFPTRDRNMPGINDILLLGRICLENQQNDQVQPRFFHKEQWLKFWEAFIGTAAALQARSTGIDSATITWSISPRKLKALYKIALAHALVCDDQLAGEGEIIGELGGKDLHVFDLIWDTTMAASELLNLTRSSLDRYGFED